MRLLLPSVISVVFYVVAGFPSSAVGQETIFDPENPAFSEEESTESSEGDASSSEEADPGTAGEETIFDPENPGAMSGDDETDVDGGDEVDEPTSSPALQTVQFQGGWSSSLRLDTAWQSPEEDVVELTSDVRLRLEWDASEAMRIVVGGEILHWMGGKPDPARTDFLVNARDVRADLDLRLDEAYVLLRDARWSLAAGNLITRWGATDLTRPGDVVNPVSLTQLDGARAGTRLAQPTVDLTYSGDGWSWQGLLVPFFVANDVWLIGRDSALLNSDNTLVAERFPIADLTSGLLDDSVIDDVQPLLQSTTVPDETPANASLGTRFTGTLANTDVGLGYFFGWDRQAYFDIDPDVRTLLVEVANDETLLDNLDITSFFLRNQEARQAVSSITEKARDGETLFQSDHRRLQTVTADLARYVGPIGVRADVAFQPEKTYFTETFSSVRRPTLSAALGLSWERIESADDLLTVTVEGYVTKPFAADAGVTESFVDEDERGDADDALLIYDDLSAGVATAVVWTIPYIDTRLQLGGLSDLTHPDLIASLELTRGLFEWLDITLGGVLFEGPPLDESFSIGGVYDNNDAVYLRVDGIF